MANQRKPKRDDGARRRKKARARRDQATAVYPSPRSYPAREGTRRGIIVGPSQFASEAGDRVMFTLDLLDLDRGGSTQRIELNFFAHGFTFDPNAPIRAVLFEKRGPGAAHVDLAERAVLATIEPMPNHHFYGHGTYSSAGDVIYAVESQLDTGEGAISIRDATTFAVLDTFPTFGARPHDCVLIDRGNTLAITNGGGALGGDQIPCVSFVAVASRKLLDQHEVTDPRINTGHIAVGAGRDFAVVSAPRDGLPEKLSVGGVTLRSRRKPWTHMTAPAEVTGGLWGETLSVALHHNTVAATTPLAGLLTFWDLQAKRLKKAQALPNVRGVTLTLDNELFVVSFGPTAALTAFDARTLEAHDLPEGGRAHFSGSHIYTWAEPAVAFAHADPIVIPV